jgi:hypothetical protein
MPPNDRNGRRDPVFGDGAGNGRGNDGPAARGPRFTLDDDDSADQRRPGSAEMRADPRDETAWRARSGDYDELYEDPRRGPPYMIIGGILVMLSVAGGAWFFYNRGLDRLPSGPPPLIQAEGGPTKIAPEQPGGAVVPNQDKLVYSRVAGERYPEPAPGAEELLAKPEVPKRPPAPAPLAPTAPATITAANEAPAIPRGMTQAELAAQVRAQASPVEITGEKAAKGAANANDNTPPPPTRGPGMLEAPKGMTAVRPTGEAAAILGVPEQGAGTVTALTPSPPTQLAPVAPAPVKPQAAPVARPAAPVAAPATGSAVVQLGALPDQDIVEREWDRLSKKHADLLGGLKKVVVAVDVPGKGTLYRLRVSGLKDAHAAQELCTKLKARNQPCLVP